MQSEQAKLKAEMLKENEAKQAEMPHLPSAAARDPRERGQAGRRVTSYLNSDDEELRG